MLLAQGASPDELDAQMRGPIVTVVPSSIRVTFPAVVSRNRICVAEWIKSRRLRVPGTVAACPLAELDREQLEGLVLGLVVMLGSVLNPVGNSAPQSLRAPLRAPMAGDSWDSLEPLETRNGKKAAV
jgi:hypothetical protein